MSHLVLCLLSLSAVESLYAALKSIDRLDIINMFEGQQGAPAPPARQGSRELNRRRHHDREHLSPGLTNGKFKLTNPIVQTAPSLYHHPPMTSPANLTLCLALDSASEILHIISMQLSVCCHHVFGCLHFLLLSNRQRDSGHSCCTLTLVASVDHEKNCLFEERKGLTVCFTKF